MGLCSSLEVGAYPADLPLKSWRSNLRAVGIEPPPEPPRIQHKKADAQNTHTDHAQQYIDTLTAKTQLIDKQHIHIATNTDIRHTTVVEEEPSPSPASSDRAPSPLPSTDDPASSLHPHPIGGSALSNYLDAVDSDSDDEDDDDDDSTNTVAEMEEITEEEIVQAAHLQPEDLTDADTDLLSTPFTHPIPSHILPTLPPLGNSHRRHSSFIPSPAYTPPPQLRTTHGGTSLTFTMSSFHVLLIDEDVAHAEVVSRWLRRKKCIVTLCQDGEEGVAVMKQLQLQSGGEGMGGVGGRGSISRGGGGGHRGMPSVDVVGEAKVEDVDLILCDSVVSCPGGSSFLDYCKQRPSISHIPMILMSIDVEPAMIDRTIRRGAHDHWLKPVNRVILHNAVRMLKEAKREAKKSSVLKELGDGYKQMMMEERRNQGVTATSNPSAGAGAPSALRRLSLFAASPSVSTHRSILTGSKRPSVNLLTNSSLCLLAAVAAPPSIMLLFPTTVTDHEGDENSESGKIARWLHEQDRPYVTSCSLLHIASVLQLHPSSFMPHNDQVRKESVDSATGVDGRRRNQSVIQTASVSSKNSLSHTSPLSTTDISPGFITNSSPAVGSFQRQLKEAGHQTASILGMMQNSSSDREDSDKKQVIDLLIVDGNWQPEEDQTQLFQQVLLAASDKGISIIGQLHSASIARITLSAPSAHHFFVCCCRPSGVFYCCHPITPSRSQCGCHTAEALRKRCQQHPL